MGWILFFVLFLVLARVCWRGVGACGLHRVQLQGSSYGCGGGSDPDRARRVHGWAPGRGPGNRRSEPRRPPPVTPTQRRERAISELRRRYVADEITVEEYELGLDRILRDAE